MTADVSAYRPPAPVLRTKEGLLRRILFNRGRDLLRLLPEELYTTRLALVPISRRPIYFLNDPTELRRVLVEKCDKYPKSDLMVGALEPLVGNGIFISNGHQWKTQREMVAPSFAHMRIQKAFSQMEGALRDFEAHWLNLSQNGERFCLEEEMSYLTADIIFRTIFSVPIEGKSARAVFQAFAKYQKAVPQIDLRIVLSAKAFSPIRQPRKVVKLCAFIREELGKMVDARQSAEADAYDDICADLLAARDPETGKPFSREELIDQIAVFFLAGHETTASVLTWAFYIISQRPEIARRIRGEVAEQVGDGPISFRAIKSLTFTRNVFRETLRLYPPVPFITRVATQDDTLRGHEIERGTMVVISPWLLHRHLKLWEDPEYFDPDRFSPEREKQIIPSSYIPFGIGPRVCTGAAFATTEATLILAQLTRSFEMSVLEPEKVEPTARLTTRPRKSIVCRAFRRNEALPPSESE
ncbi:cytochrome P450 [Rhodobacteraceae bacterium RKSG542]|uniref:cytochrome P450 n=1 Tax=Pseudovibrio flavus TaxID=2529854 RepID=UPI0012BB5975|nr:cytochrome P450 [Pseudovibrio flavus]MTI17306.1 cytochrome P450 [Pseudovibrio flavus]